jgi:hypothetical protein
MNPSQTNTLRSQRKGGYSLGGNQDTSSESQPWIRDDLTHRHNDTGSRRDWSGSVANTTDLATGTGIAVVKPTETQQRSHLNYDNIRTYT